MPKVCSQRTRTRDVATARVYNQTGRDDSRQQHRSYVTPRIVVSGDAVTAIESIKMSAAKAIRDANVTPVSTPPGAQPSDAAIRSILAKRAARIDELEIENATLQAQLQQALLRAENNVPVLEPPQNTAATRTKDDYEILRQRYEYLDLRYQKLQDDYKKREKYVETATKKYNAAKTSAKQWQAYVKKQLYTHGKEDARNALDQSNELLPPPPPIPREVSDIEITPRPLRQASPERGDAGKEAQTTNTSILESSKHAGTSSVTNHGVRSPASSLHSKRITSSQTTEDDQAEARSYAVKVEPCSDEEPEVVRENVLKRRKRGSGSAMPPPQRIKQESESPTRPGSAETPIELRSEEWSSPASRARPLMRMETSDLDAMRGTYQTPRKRKATDESRARSEERSTSTLHPPRPLARNSSSLSDSDIPDLPALPIAFEQAEDNMGERQRLERRANVIPKERSHVRRRGPLGQLSPNVPTMPQTSKKRRRTSEEDAGKVSMLAEDGDEETSQVTPKAEPGTAKTPASNRLDAMLENPTPGRQPLSARRPAPDTFKRTRPQRPQQKVEPQSHNKATASAPRFRRPPGLEKSPPPINPESEPLRSRKLQQLRPQDFRINPAFADSDYAYADPMNRKTKAARRCLPGCINPACCGEFLDAARHGLLPPSSKSDAQVLEDMLGSSHAEIMAAYSPSKRKEVLIQARAQEFANEHGRHRKTFERAATPPGFWRTEMPSTQEELEDRRKAEEMERMKVEGMWREAMRGGGRWLFRDE